MNIQKTILLLLLPLLLLSGCKSKKQVLEKPADLISRNKMVDIIAESFIIESTVHLAPDSVNRLYLTRDYYKELFTRHNVTRAQFVRSIDYYIGEENSAEKLLTDVSTRLSEMRKELNVPDSLSTPIAPEKGNPFVPPIL